MDRLPPELHHRIVHYIGRRIGEDTRPVWEHGALPYALPVVAAVSRSFQYAVERLTFQRLSLSTSPDDLDALRRILTPRRQSCLQHLAVCLWVDHAPSRKTTTPPLPRPFATEEERRATDEAMATHLRDFFNVLASWSVPGSSLILEVSGPSVSRDTRDISGNPYRRFSLLGMSASFADLPALPMVKHLYVSSLSYHLHPRLAMSLTAKMPNASRVAWDLSTSQDVSWGLYHHMSRIWRDGLVQAIESSTLPPSVEKFTFNMPVPGTSEFQILPDFLGSSSAPDPVSTALRKLTKDCVEVCIDGSIHPSLFDPATTTTNTTTTTTPDHHETTPAVWAKLTRLEVRACMRGPDGRWLFKLNPDNEATPPRVPADLDFERPPPGYGATEAELDAADDYYDQFEETIAPEELDATTETDFWRSAPEDEPMNALLAAFARACGAPALLPALRSATLQCAPLDAETAWPFQANCYAAGQPAPSGWDAALAAGDRGAWRVYLHVGEWRPSPATLDALRRVGRARGGDRDAVVGYLPWGDFLD